MPFLGETFSTNDLPQSDSYDPLPEGWYNVRITEADIQTTKAGTGRYIKLRLDVIGPSHEGRVLFTNLNINNANPEAERIGRQQLGDVLRAIGLAAIEDTDQLVGGTMSVKAVIKQQEGYEPRNEIKRYKALDGSAPPVAAAKPAAASASAPAKAAPPWAAKK